MKEQRPLYISIFLVLALLAGLTSVQNYRAIVADKTRAKAATVKLRDIARTHIVSDCRLFARKKGSKLSFLTQKYFINTHIAAYTAAASFTLNAPSLYDISVGDISTGYPCPYNNYLNVLIDLGASPVGVSKYEAAGLSPSHLSVTLAYSSDGVNWNDAGGGAHNADGTVITLPGTITARYWQFAVFNNDFAGGAHNVTDARLYDGSAALINGPSSAPTVTLAPTQAFDAQKNPIDAVAWTSTNATAVSIAASTGPSPGSVAPVAGGSVGVTPPSTGATYTATATGPGGTATASASISAAPVMLPGAFGLSINGVPGIAIEGV